MGRLPVQKSKKCFKRPPKQRPIPQRQPHGRHQILVLHADQGLAQPPLGGLFGFDQFGQHLAQIVVEAVEGAFDGGAQATPLQLPPLRGEGCWRRGWRPLPTSLNRLPPQNGEGWGGVLLPTSPVRLPPQNGEGWGGVLLPTSLNRLPPQNGEGWGGVSLHPPLNQPPPRSGEGWGGVRGVQPIAQKVRKNRLDAQILIARHVERREQPPIDRLLQHLRPALVGQTGQGRLLPQLCAVDFQHPAIQRAGKGSQAGQQGLGLRRKIAVGVFDAAQYRRRFLGQEGVGGGIAYSVLRIRLGIRRGLPSVVCRRAVQCFVPRLQGFQHCPRRLVAQVGQDDFQGQGMAVEQGEEVAQVRAVGRVAGEVGHAIALQNALGQGCGRLRVQTGQLVAPGRRRVGQPALRPPGAEEDQTAPPGQPSHKVAQFGPLALVQQMADGQGRAGDGFQIVQHQQMALGTQLAGQFGLPSAGVGQPLPAKIVGVEGAADLVQHLFQAPGPLVVAAIDHLLHQPGGLPPLHQMAQEGTFARAPHPLHQTDVALAALGVAAQQPPLQFQNVHIPPHKAVGGRGRGIAAGLGRVPVGLGLGIGKGRGAQLDGPVFIDHRQQPVGQIDGLVIGGPPRPLLVEFQTGGADGLVQGATVQQAAVEGRHQQLGRADCDRIAHPHHQLHPRGHQAAAQAGVVGGRDLPGFRKPGRSALHSRLAGVENGDGKLVALEQVRHLLGGHSFGLAGDGAIEEEKGPLAVEGGQPGRAQPVNVGRSGSPPGFVVFGRSGSPPGFVAPQPGIGRIVQQAAVEVEVDKLVIAVAPRGPALVQMAHERFPRAGADQIDLRPHPAFAQGCDQRAGDSAVAHIAAAAGAGGHQQHIQRGRGAQAGLEVGRGQIFAHQRRFHGKGAGVHRVLQGFPVQGVEGRGTGDLQVELPKAARIAHGKFVRGQDIRKALENLAEEAVAVLFHTGRGLRRLHPVGEGEAEPLLEVPGQPGLLVGIEGIADINWVLPGVVKANFGDKTAVYALGGLADEDTHWLLSYKAG